MLFCNVQFSKHSIPTPGRWIQVLDRLLLPVLLAASIFISFNQHSKHTFDTYHDVLWADAAGYYVYLPGLFINGGMDGTANAFDLQDRTGKGFHTGKDGFIMTKYTYGVALLESPFFAVGHMITLASDEQADGFSRYYQKLIMLAAICYTMLGLLLLKIWLKRYFPLTAVLVAVFFIYMASNLLYYTVDKSGMSHAYSFFLFAATMLALDNYKRESSMKRAFLLALPFCLAVLIRPTAILLLVIIVFYQGKDKLSAADHIRWWGKRWKQVLLMGGTGLLLAVPQVIYWYTTTGKLFSYSYENEGFTNFSSPHLIELWFSPKNGLIPWAPIVILMIAGLVIMLWKKRSNAWPIAFVFLISSFLFASWWNWTFGCSFGARSFVEYYVILAIPLCWLIGSVLQKGTRYFKFGVLPALLLLAIVNVKMLYAYDDCYYGSTWDFTEYLRLLTEW